MMVMAGTLHLEVWSSGEERRRRKEGEEEERSPRLCRVLGPLGFLCNSCC